MSEQVKPKELAYFLLLSGKTSFWKLDDLFPECSFYREKCPRIDPLICLRENSCHVGSSCMQTIGNRLQALFDTILPKWVQLVLLYYKKQCGLGAGVFWRDFREPYIITMNSGAWARVKLRSEIYKFLPGNSFYLTGSSEKPSMEAEETKITLP